MSTGKKQQIMTYIAEYSAVNGIFPTLNEIKDGVGLKSVSTVHQHIKDLIEIGSIRIDEAGNHTLKSTENIKMNVPIIGYIAAGEPIEVIEDVISHIVVTDLPQNGDFYALKVKGTSMIDEGIFDNDIVIIKRQTSAQNGQTVVAIIDEDQATLKKLYKEDGRFKLQPANQSMLPFFRDEVEVRGVV